MINLTPLESATLNQVEAACRAYGGETWADCISDYGPIRGNVLSGAISALARKGLVRCSGNGRDQIVSLIRAA